MGTKYDIIVACWDLGISNSEVDEEVFFCSH